MGPVNLDVPYFSLLLLVAFVLKHNLDEEICEILTPESRKTRIAEGRMLI